MSSSSNNQINSAGGSGEESYHVYVGDIGPEVDNAKLKQVFAEFGNITQSKVIKDTSTQTSKGYGFVTFSHREDAEKAIAQKNGSWLGFNLIKCNWATRKPTNTNRSLKYDEVYKMASQNNTTAYIGNLDINISQEAIRNLCSKQGKIVDLKLYNEKGYGFAKYATKDEACRAIVNIHGSKINNTTLKASWGKEDSVLSSQMIDYNLAQSLSTSTGMGMSSGADQSNMYMSQQQPYNQNAMSVNPYNSQYVQQSALPYSMPQGQSANSSTSPQSAANSSANASQQQALALQQMYMMMYQQQLYNNQVAAASGGATATPGSNTAGQQGASAAATNPALASALMAHNQGNMSQQAAYGGQQQVAAGSNTSPYWNIPKTT
ncbi:MAG: Nucleolysin TIAR [Marteilia pararefringens]